MFCLVGLVCNGPEGTLVPVVGMQNLSIEPVMAPPPAATTGRWKTSTTEPSLGSGDDYCGTGANYDHSTFGVDIEGPDDDREPSLCGVGGHAEPRGSGNSHERTGTLSAPERHHSGAATLPPQPSMGRREPCRGSQHPERVLQRGGRIAGSVSVPSIPFSLPATAGGFFLRFDRQGI